MGGLTDFASALEYTFDSICEGASRFIIFISDFIATKRPAEIPRMLKKVTDQGIKVSTTWKLFFGFSAQNISSRLNY